MAGTSARSPKFLDRGTLVGGAYLVLGPLVAGSSAVSMLAKDERLDRTVVLQLLAPREGVSAKALLRSARLLARVTSDQVASVYDIGDHAGQPFVVLEHVVGEDLRAYVGKRSLSTSEILDAIEQLARAIAAIHAAGAVHGTVCPENVVVGPGFRITLSDFGFAPCDVDPSFVAPEARALDVALEGEAGRRTDAYAVAATARALLTGSLDARFGTTGAEPSLPPPLDRTLAAMLAADPDRRAASLDALRHAIADALPLSTMAALAADVLVVDDDPDFRALAELCLRTALPGCVVHAASDGRSALARIESTELGLALVDLELPGQNGIELTAAVRGSKRNARTPVLVVTGRGSAADWKVLSALGADGFVVKPIDPAALVSAVRRVVERASRSG